MSYKDTEPRVSPDRFVGRTRVATLRGIFVVSTIKLSNPDNPGVPYETMVFDESDEVDPEVIYTSITKEVSELRHRGVVEHLIHGRLVFQKDWWEE